MCAGGTKASGLELDRSVLEGIVEDLSLNVLRSESTKVRGPMECREIMRFRPHLSSDASSEAAR